jgi:Arc/MetJ-type ribon-helix-helix transcriptional regulator
MTVRDRYKSRRADRSTFSFHLERSSMADVQKLVAAGIYENRSHAVDEALRLLLMVHRPQLAEAFQSPETANVA